MSRRPSLVVAVALGITLTLAGCSSSSNGAPPAPGGVSGSNAPPPQSGSGSGGPSGSAGSGAPTGPVAPLPPAGGDPVKWADNLCTPLSEFTKSIADQAATMSQVQDQSQIQAKLGQLVDDMATGLGRTVDRLKTIEPSPIKGADDVKNKIVEAYQKSQQVLKDAAGKVRGGDQDAAAQILQSLGDETSKITDPFKDNTNDALRDAMGKAAACKDITGG
ncbi:hypothetical protein [Actinocrispum wychmicini]|uniref:Small secreted protein n=1 Tax=Actinocrispum wychmicini TaxID=1213861 RepID=A0A4R2JYF9_9PSEU|nr:hypothetical protein [Actinocrispum wychmicini]TCO64272.1 hypothetical protein EV192_10137 [Actinocrispum wychmicini]